MSKQTKFELLAPAGSPEKAKYAFAYGADAIYLGIPDFSMRVRINRFTIDSVKEVIAEAKKQKKKVYVTANIYAHNDHLKRLPAYLKKLNEWRPTALIISDPGIMMLARQYAPNVPIHLSTQANATNWQAVKYWYDQGVERVVLGREVTLKEIKEIHRRVPKCEIEYFVHGAMCMSYSGRCMLSSWLTGRSANLGDCAQPCRWKYKNGTAEFDSIVAEVEEPLRPGMMIPVEEDQNGTYIFNSKDLCLIEHLPELIDAGVVSFKIEGRAKSVAYLSTVIKAYREAFDLLAKKGERAGQKKQLKKIKKNRLDTLMHRGYTTGFLFGRDTVEQNITNSHTGTEEQFVGEAISSKKQGAKSKEGSEYLVTIRPHNALRLGDKVRIMQPTGKDLQITIEKMYNEEGEEVDSGHGGSGANVVFKISKPVESFSILFKTG